MAEPRHIIVETKKEHDESNRDISRYNWGVSKIFIVCIIAGFALFGMTIWAGGAGRISQNTTNMLMLVSLFILLGLPSIICFFRWVYLAITNGFE